MENLVWLIIMIPCSMLFTGIGIYAMKAKKPMWFWSGSTVKESEISDVEAYNRANGLMWIGFSLLFWLSVILSFFSMKGAVICLILGCLVGIPMLPLAYSRIYKKYKR